MNLEYELVKFPELDKDLDKKTKDELIEIINKYKVYLENYVGVYAKFDKLLFDISSSTDYFRKHINKQLLDNINK